MPVPLTARHPVAFTPPALLERNIALAEEQKTPISLTIRIPTMYERDSFAAQMVRGGVVQYSRQQVRDLMLAGVMHLHDEVRFETIRGELEELWQAADAGAACQARRTQRFVEIQEQQAELPEDKRMNDQAIGQELLKIAPDIVMDEKKRVRITAMQQDVTARYEPLQKAFADLAEQDTRRNWLCVEIYVANWHGIEHTPAGNGRGGVTRHEAEYLREHIGQEAFDQVGGFVMALHAIDGDEEKNLASLIESSSAPIGSPLAESMKPSEHGTSTDAPSIAIPDTESQTTTASLSSSTKPSRKKTARSGASPTARRSSTSPSS